MAETEADSGSPGLLYSLCAVAAAAAILNAVLLLWQALKLHKTKGFSFVKYSLLLLDAFYSLTALALILIVLYRDTGGKSLCAAGGYLILAGSQLSLWIQTTSCVSLLLWMKKSLSPDWQRRNVLFFGLIAFAQCFVIAVVAAIPYMGLPYFDSSQAFYFTCTPLQLPGQEGWTYAVLVLILDWIALAVGIVALVKICLHCSSCRNPVVSAAERLEELYVERSCARQQRQAFLTLAVCSAGWAAVLVLANVTYFSDGKLDRNTGQWVLGFGLGVTLCLRPAFVLAHHVCSGWLTRRGHGLKTLSASLCQSRPSGLQRLARLPDSHQTLGVQKYLVQWRDERSNEVLSGTMKLFSPASQHLWRNEVNAIERLGAERHPNVAGYLWVSPHNPFTQSICMSTGDPVSRHTGVTCRAHFGAGSLADFLRTHIQQLSEPSLHRVALDVATGLEFLHQRRLVHNGLSSNSVFMHSVSEKYGVKAVIGDLEHSYQVSADAPAPGLLYRNKQTWSECDTTELFTISSKMALQQDSTENRFAPDIRAFGLLVLEMLVGVSHHKQRTHAHAHSSRVSRLLEDVLRDATDGDAELPVETSTPHDHQLYDGASDRSGAASSSRVVDVRVHSEDSTARSSEDGPVGFRTLDASSLGRPVDDSGVLLQHEETELCGTCAHAQAHACVDSPASPDDEHLCATCQYEDVSSALPSVGTRKSVALAGGGKTPPKLSVRAFSATDRNKNFLQARNLNHQVSPDHVVELPEIGESDTESVALIYRPYARRGSYSGKQILTNGSFLTPRNTPEVRTPTSRSDSSATTPTSLPRDAKSPNATLNDSSSSSSDAAETKPQNSPREAESRQDVNTATALKLQEIGFQTIYEEDENQSGTLPRKTKPQVPPKPKRLLKPTVPPKRRPPPPLPRGETSQTSAESAGKKRLSMASLDESVVSAADSGLGSSHYDGSSYCGSEISSIYQPGSRNTIYSGSMTEGSEVYCSVKPGPLVLDKKSGGAFKPMDSGIESSVDSCDELNDRPGRRQQQDTQTVRETRGETEEGNANDENSANNTYEQLPDLPDENPPEVLPRRKEKQPCVGHHEHLDNSTCTAHQAHTPASPSKKTSVTISTQTTDSLERPKAEKGHRDSVVEGEWKTLLDHAGDPGRSEGSAFSTPPRNQCVQPVTMRQKTVLHQETVYSQPVYSQTAIYPQRLQAPMPPPKQTYNQDTSSLVQQQRLQSPRTDTFHAHIKSSRSMENLYDEHRHHGYKRPLDMDQRSMHELNHNPHSLTRALRSSREHVHAPGPPQLPPSYPNHWSDHRHNLAYYSKQYGLRETLENNGSAFKGIPAPDSKYRVPSYLEHQGRYSQSDEGQMSLALDRMRRDGRLGHVAGQMMPLVKECYAQNPGPSADQVLHRLEQMLPTAAV